MQLKQLLTSWLAAWAPALNLVSAVHPRPDPGAWWKEGVTYQVYPASFKDSDGDGWGDIKGITSKLDHIKDLGVDIIWVSPIYESPMVDMGYDISNYTRVNPLFGTLDDVKELLDEVHKRDMKCIFDLVVNHSSDEHEWFQTSRNDPDSKEHDYYLWKEGKKAENGSTIPPNNWAGSSNGSSWAWDDKTQEYYLHIFTEQQPDFNWTNPDARQAIYDNAMKYWLDMGVDGFRMDVFNLYSKPDGLPDVPANDDGFHDASKLYNNGPHIHEYLKEMNQQVLSHYDTFTVGEYSTDAPNDEAIDFVKESNKEINTLFLMSICTSIARNNYEPSNWTFKEWREAFDMVQKLPGQGGWNTVFLENHDNPRSVSTFCNDSKEYQAASGRLLSMLLSTMSGSLFMLQGQEIGMANVPDDWPWKNFRDEFGIEYYDGEQDKAKAVANLRKRGRDNARTPFNWDNGDGFSTNKTTWIPRVHPEINLKDQQDDPNSVFNFWKKALKFRKQHKDVFIYGDYKIEENESKRFFAYSKQAGNKRALVVLNFEEGKRKPTVDIPKGAKLALCTHDNCDDNELQAYEGRVYWV